MLSELRISNFALIDAQSISFAHGFNVISGESGSGKSIVLQAIDLILGGKPKAQHIRSGAEAFEIEALFTLNELAPQIRATLPDIAQADELLVSRVFAANGKGKIYINGKLGSQSLLQEITSKIVNICGQGHTSRLLSAEFHLELIDEYAGCQELLKSYREAYDKWRELEAKLAELEENSRQAGLRQATLEVVISELGSITLTKDRRTELETAIRQLANLEKAIELRSEAEQLLLSEAGLLAVISQLGSKLGELSKIDANFEAAHLAAGQAESLLSDLDKTLRSSKNELEDAPQSLERLQAELSEISRLERKYRLNCEGLAQLLIQAREELAILSSEDGLDLISKNSMEAQAKAQKIALELSAKRKSAVKRLCQAVESELSELNMPDAKLKVELEDTKLGPSGKERACFFVAPNKGEAFKLLSQIASGGELSRIMLVLKKILRDRSGVNVLVFDEVDSGVSGKVARAVGKKLSELAEHSQVICITHLAQVASLADHHLCVEKVTGKRTISVIRELNSEEKVDEIARMLAGYDITKASRESAKELLTSKS